MYWLHYCSTLATRCEIEAPVVTYYASFLSINTSVARDCIKCSCVHVRNDHFVRRNEEGRSGGRGGGKADDKRTNAREVAQTHTINSLNSYRTWMSFTRARARSYVSHGVTVKYRLAVGYRKYFLARCLSIVSRR